jgi:energy-coupling factor transporter ATP-binding protein EcfA2
MRRDLIAGGNFSGRSAALREQLQCAGAPAFFLGPYAEAALSGLSSTVADEIAVYARAVGRSAFAPIDWSALRARKPATLSGGEQVLLALHCFSRSEYGTIGIDTALEQLDEAHRARALDYLASSDAFDVLLIDNRLDPAPPAWARRTGSNAGSGFPCDLAALVDDLRPRAAPLIAVQGLEFGYPGGRTIFRDLDLSLTPGRAYRLTGPNGAGKTTFFKLLVGVLAPARGAILLDGRPYRPRRRGNRVFALATQNPDHQWCGATLGEDLKRRRAALAAAADRTALADERVAAMAQKLGAGSMDQHLYELPLAARKRLSWLWPFLGALPWLMLDEPTIGQDRATRDALAAILHRLCALGYGVIVVTHDDDFADRAGLAALRIADLTIRPA